MTQSMGFLGKCSLCTWKECEICCSECAMHNQLRLVHGAFKASIVFMILVHHLLKEGVEISNHNCGFVCFLVLFLVFAPSILSSVIGCVNIKRRQSTKELMLLNCGAGENS